jgi:nucleotide-binding universal stress UspA family protein
MTNTGQSSPTRVAGRIVVGVDGSDESLAALRWALQEARLRGAVLHATIGWSYHPSWGDSGMGSLFPPGYSPPGGVLPGMLEPELTAPSGSSESAEAAAAAAVGNVLDAAISRAVDLEGEQPPVTITSQAVQGHAVTVLLEAVTESDLLVVGSRGHGGFAGALLGSVSHHVVSHARCPVVVVPTPR